MKKGIIIISFMILILLFDKVNASTFANGIEVQYFKEEALTNRYSSNNWYDYIQTQSGQNINSWTQFDFYPNPQINIQDIKGGHIEFTYYFELPMVERSTTTTTNNTIFCTQWTQSGQNYSCNTFGTSNVGVTFDNRQYIQPMVNMNAVIIYNNGYADYCSMDTSNNKFICPISNFQSLTSIKFIRFSTNVYYDANYRPLYYFGIMRRVNRYSSDASQIIDNQNQNTDKIINETTTYDTNATEPTNGTTINEYTQKEDQLFTIMDFNATSQTITINPNTSNFIWLIVERLRTISPYIILFMTSVLALGLIKMVLNR